MNQPVEYVGFWLRVAAAFIDTAAVSTVILPILLIIFSDSLPIENHMSLLIMQTIVVYVLPFIAIILFWIYRSATPGKMVIGAIIVDAHTLQAPSKSQLIIRYIGYYLSSLPLFLGLMWVGWDKRKQGFHDKLARTVVIRKPS